MLSEGEKNSFSTGSMIIFTFSETLKDPSLTSAGPPPPSPPLIVSYPHAYDGAWGKKRKWGGERAGRETELIIQIQSLKGKCVFQAVKMINGREQILTNALV